MADNGGPNNIASLGVEITAPGADDAKAQAIGALNAIGAAAKDNTPAVDAHNAALADMKDRLNNMTPAQQQFLSLSQQEQTAMAAALGVTRESMIARMGLTDAIRSSAAAEQESAAASTVAAEGHAVHGLQLGRLNMELGTFIGRLTGANTAVTRLSAMIGGSVVGYGAMIAVLVGVAASIDVIEKLAGYDKEAAKQQEELNKATDRWYDIHSRGIAGDQLEKLDAETTRVTQLTQRYNELVLAQRASQLEGGPQVDIFHPFSSPGDIQESAQQLDDLHRKMTALQQDIDKTRLKEWFQEVNTAAREEADLVKDGLGNPQLIEQMRQQMASFAQQAKDFAAAGPGSRQAALAMSEAYKTLKDALTGLDKPGAELAKLTNSISAWGAETQFVGKDRTIENKVVEFNRLVDEAEQKFPTLISQFEALRPKIDAAAQSWEDFNQKQTLAKIATAGSDAVETLQAQLDGLGTKAKTNTEAVEAWYDTQLRKGQALYGDNVQAIDLYDKWIDKEYKLRLAIAQRTDALNQAKDAAKGDLKDDKADARMQQVMERLVDKPLDNALRGVQGDISNFFVAEFSGSKGQNAVEQFWTNFRQLAIKTFAEIASMDLMEQIFGYDPESGQYGSMQGMAAKMASAIGLYHPAAPTTVVPLPGMPATAGTDTLTSGGAGAGAYAMAAAGVLGSYGVGQSTENPFMAALLGAGSGALGGSAFGVPGAVVGGVVGLIGGIFGNTKRHSDDAAKALQGMSDAAKSVTGVLNGPQGFKIELDRFMAALPQNGNGGNRGYVDKGGLTGGNGSVSPSGIVINGDVHVHDGAIADGPSFIRAVQRSAITDTNRGGPGVVVGQGAV